PHIPPAASLPAHPPAPPPSPSVLPHTRSAPPPPLLVQSDTPGSSPDDPSVPETLYSRPAGNAHDLPSGNISLPPLPRTHPAQTSPPLIPASPSIPAPLQSPRYTTPRPPPSA